MIQGLSTAWREDGAGSPYSSKRIGGTFLLIATVAAGFFVLAVIAKIGMTGASFNAWLSIALVAVPALFLVGAIVLFFFSTKKDLDDTIKLAAEIVQAHKMEGGA